MKPLKCGQVLSQGRCGSAETLRPWRWETPGLEGRARPRPRTTGWRAWPHPRVQYSLLLGSSSPSELVFLKVFPEGTPCPRFTCRFFHMEMPDLLGSRPNSAFF